MKNYILTALLTLSINLSFGQTEEKHPIDIQRENCLDIDSNQTTIGMVDCERITADLWDKQLNEYYNSLMKLLNKEEKQSLKESQLKWLEYRDSEMKFYGSFYNNMDGTICKIVAAGRRCDVIRTRALELKEYLDILTVE